MMMAHWVLLVTFTVAYQQCTHQIFCSEPILKAIAKANLFEDSKTFVDLVLKVPVNTALSNFLAYNISEFVRLSFHQDTNLILQSTSFDDFQDDPAFLRFVKDESLRAFAKELHGRWNLLGKRVVLANAQKEGTCIKNCSSFLQELDGRKILVPGGRFRQSYYWDTYWIILGLITSDMLTTAEEILSSFLLVINKYGFVPNGFRQYYLNRSQPPLYFLMVKKVADAIRKKGDYDRAKALEQLHFPAIEKEFAYWKATHARTVVVDGNEHNVAQYRAATYTPRPESYRQDINTVDGLSGAERDRVLNCLSSMAESGWDFSSRWLQGDSLRSTVMDDIVPSDLNAIIGLQATYLANLASKYSISKMDFYAKEINSKTNYFKAIKREGRFPDLRISDPKAKPRSVYPTDYLPFQLFSETALATDFFNGLVNPAASQLKTGQQWDAPNVWAPNNWILSEVAPPQQAEKLGKQWIKTTYCSWKKTGNLYEKYRSDAFGERGEGGEYVVQTGFGWTNGLALHYISLYGENYIPGEC